MYQQGTEERERDRRKEQEDAEVRKRLAKKKSYVSQYRWKHIEKAPPG